MDPSSASWGRPRFAEPAELEPEALNRQRLLAETCAALGRCLFPSSVYEAGHPMVATSAEQASQGLQQLSALCPDLTLAVEPAAWNALVSVEGAFSEPVLLTTLIGGLAGQQFSERFQAFMDTRGMVSFSIKTHMPADEFKRFHETFVRHLASQPTDHNTSIDPGTLGTQFLGELKAQNVFHASAILRADLTDHGRALPWRERLALARLSRDTQLLTLYTQLNPEQRERAKLSLFSDVLGLVPGETSTLRLLCNLDTIAQQVEGVTGTPLDADLVAALPEHAVAITGQSMLELRHRLAAATHALPPTMRPDILDVLLRNLSLVGTRLAPLASSESDFDLLHKLVDEGAIALEVVPEWLQSRIQVERWLPAFLQDPQSYLSTTDRITEAGPYWPHVMALVGAIPPLLKQRRFDEVGAIARFLDEHRNVPGPFPERANLAIRAIDELDSELVATHFLEELPNASPERRDQLRRCSGLLGADAVPVLINGLSDNGDQTVLSEVVLALRHVGQPAREPIVQLLKTTELPPALVSSLMKVLGEVPPSETTWELLQRYVRHEAEQVRVAALDAVHRQWGPSARALYMRALADMSPAVVCKAIRALATLDDHETSFISWLVDLVDENDPDRQTTDRVQVAAIEALASMGDMNLGELGSLESIFLRRFDEGRPSRVAALVGKQTEGSEAIQVALCDGLALIGGDDSLRRLRDTGSEGRIAVRSRMERAAAMVATRLGSVAA